MLLLIVRLFFGLYVEDMNSPSVKEVRPGVFVFRMSLGTDPVTGRRLQQRITVHGKKSDAVRRLKELEAEKLSRDHPSSAITLTNVRKLWDEATQIQGTRRFTTAIMEASAYRRYLEPALGDVPLHRLSSELIQRTYDKLYLTLAPSSVRRIHQQLSSILHWAEIRGYLHQDVTRRVKIKAVKRLPPVGPLFEDVETLIASVQHDDDLWLMIRLTSSLGLRRGEVAGLRFGDLDIDRGELAVERSVAVKTGEQPITVETKTGEIGRATFEIDSDLQEELCHRRNQLLSAAFELGVSVESFFIFHSKNPLVPRRPDFFSRRMATHRRNNPEMKRITLKKLRIFVGSEFAENDVDLATSQAVLRHSDHNTTAQFYVAKRVRRIRQVTVSHGELLGRRIRT